MRKLLVLACSAVLCAGLASPAEAATKKFTVTTKLDESSIYLGQPQRVTGSVSPASPGKTVKVYIHYASDSAGEYHYVGKSTLNSKSRFSKSFKPQDSGSSRIKVVKAASGSRKSGYSSKGFKNFAARELSTLQRTVEAGVVANDDTFTVGGLEANGDGYRFANDGRARWDLRRQCKTFYALGGVPDGATGTIAQAKLLARKTATGGTLRTFTGGVMEAGESEELYVSLVKKVDGENVYARYLTITTQAQGGTYPRYGIIQTYLMCNLPGGQYDPDYE